MIGDIFTSPWFPLAASVVIVVAGYALVVAHRRRHPPLRKEDREPATSGAQRQIDEVREDVHSGLRAMFLAGAVIILGLGFTGSQIQRAFDRLDTERAARISASASINTFLCQKIDRVGNGVAALVAVNLRQVPEQTALTEGQREIVRQFRTYVQEQRKPPRCEQLARKVATLTGADPADIVITPIHLRPGREEPDRGKDRPGRQSPDPPAGPATPPAGQG